MTIKEKTEKWMHHPEVETLEQHQEFNTFQSELIVMLLKERKRLHAENNELAKQLVKTGKTGSDLENFIIKRDGFKDDNIIN
ncbi:MAG: hypothetical protein ACYCZO_12090 [Daejeonella sp.]